MERTRVCLIVGKGNAEASVIQAGLNDLREDSHIVYLWDGKPSDGQAHVLDWLLMFKKGQFTIVHDGVTKIHPAIQSAAGEILKADSLMVDAFELYPKYTTLVLWDEVDGVPTQLTTEACMASLRLGMSTVDLCNGLVPLYLEEPQPSVASEAPRKPQDASKPPTPRETAPLQETPLKSLPDASDRTFVLVYVNEHGIAESFTGSGQQVTRFIKSLG